MLFMSPCAYVYKYVGATLDEGTGATMSEDEDEAPMLEVGLDMGSDGHDMMGFGPLMPTDSERSLMERVRQELKMELKQVKKETMEKMKKKRCYVRVQLMHAVG
jgi:hypothetical protein